MTGVSYKINKYVNFIGLMTDNGNVMINFNHNLHVYFVDIIDQHFYDDNKIKIRIYMPDGENKVGWHSKDCLDIHCDDIFDGRFNHENEIRRVKSKNFPWSVLED